MTIKTKSTNKKVEIDLKSPQGNAFFLIGSAVRYAKQIGLTKEESDTIVKEMQSGDYDNLIEVFDRNFGEYVDLIK